MAADSTVVLTLYNVPVLSVIGPPGVITCTSPSVILNGSGSVGNTYQWTNAAGQNLGNGPTLLVNQAGCYNLTVSNILNGVTCTDVETVCVTSNLIPPGLPVIQGLTSVCINQSATYQIAIDPNATTYDWTLPPGATLITGGDGIDLRNGQLDGPCRRKYLRGCRQRMRPGARGMPARDPEHPSHRARHYRHGYGLPERYRNLFSHHFLQHDRLCVDCSSRGNHYQRAGNRFHYGQLGELCGRQRLPDTLQRLRQRSSNLFQRSGWTIARNSCGRRAIAGLCGRYHRLLHAW